MTHASNVESFIAVNLPRHYPVDEKYFRTPPVY